MNEDFLDAECVLNHLANLKVIKMQTWKDTDLKDHEYSVLFEMPGGTGCIGLQVIKRSGRYYVYRSRIAILARRFGFNADAIYANCAVEPA